VGKAIPKGGGIRGFEESEKRGGSETERGQIINSSDSSPSFGAGIDGFLRKLERKGRKYEGQVCHT